MTAPPARPHILKSINSAARWSLSSTNEWGEDDAWDSGSDSESKPSHPTAAKSLSQSGTLSRSGTSKTSTVTPHASTSSSSHPHRPDPIPISPRRKTSMNGGLSRARDSLPSSNSTNGGVPDGASSLAFSFTHVSHPSSSSYPATSNLASHPELESGHLGDDDENDWQEQERDERERAGWTIVRSDYVGPESSLTELSAVSGDLDSSLVVGGLEPSVFDPDDSEDEPVKEGQDAIVPDAEEIAKDPMFAIRKEQLAQAASSPLPSTTASRDSSPGQHSLGSTRGRAKGKSRASIPLERSRSLRSNRKYGKVVDCLSKPDVNMSDLRKLAWAGLPPTLRPVAWPLLLGYLPLNESTRLTTLQRKRDEYRNLVDLTFASANKNGGSTGVGAGGRGQRDGLDGQIWHQIEIDVPRTRPGVRLWMEAATQRSLERILYVWAIRHPASGYVQGINDLVTPFFQVFLSAYIDCDPESFDPSHLPPDILNAIEADSFWCLSRLLDGIQDNYINQQPGIQRSVRRMSELVGRIDAPLAAHLQHEGVEFMQFAFRWMNCLLMREISVKNTIRMWDTYLAEGTEAFSQFHLYVCSAFLVKWSAKLKEMDFQGIIMFLQSLPTQDWGDHEVELLLSEAFLLNSVWHNAQSHFGTGSTPGGR